MESLLPVAQAPILRMSGGGMSGGGMETLLPAAPPVHIAGMHGGASLLPVAPSVPIAGMHGGADLYSIPYGAIYNTSVHSDHVASFGIVNTFSRKETALPEKPPCAPITDTPAPLCDILYPFVDRRVQALLNRVRFPSGDADIDMGCGRIVRKGKDLTISFHEKAITLLSCDLTGTFAKFHTGMPRYTPILVEKSDKGLLSWMLGSPVTDTGVFNLITFMDQMKTQNPILSLQGFRQFLSYHKENVEEMDVLRYAMELYGYRTGAIANTKDLYGLILSPTNAVRRVDDTFSMYKDGTVNPTEWKSEWESKGGFAVFEPIEAPVVSASSAKVSSSSVAGVAGPAVSTKPSGAKPSGAKPSGAKPSAASDVTSITIVPPSGPLASSVAPVKSSAAASAAASAASPLSQSVKNDIQYLKGALEHSTGTKLDTMTHMIPLLNGSNPSELSKAVAQVKAGMARFESYKISDEVNVKDKEMIGGHEYDLRGMIQHIGSTDRSGHYIYFYRDLMKPNRQWIRFDDSNSPQHQDRPEEIKDGYVYLFERGNGADVGHRGITNLGSSCWMNAAIQMFYHIPEYRAYIESFDPNNYQLPPDINTKTLIIQRIFQQYATTNSVVTCEKEYEDVYTELFPNTALYQQQDPMEFIRSILLYIIDSLDDKQTSDGYKDNDKRMNLRNLFQIITYSIQTCDDPKSSSRSQPSLLMTLPLPIDSNKTLNDIIRAYTSTTSSDTYSVNGKVCPTATITTHIETGDNNKYVIISLNRFGGRLVYS